MKIARYLSAPLFTLALLLGSIVFTQIAAPSQALAMKNRGISFDGPLPPPPPWRSASVSLARISFDGPLPPPPPWRNA